MVCQQYNNGKVETLYQFLCVWKTYLSFFLQVSMLDISLSNKTWYDTFRRLLPHFPAPCMTLFSHVASWQFHHLSVYSIPVVLYVYVAYDFEMYCPQNHASIALVSISEPAHCHTVPFFAERPLEKLHLRLKYDFTSLVRTNQSSPPCGNIWPWHRKPSWHYLRDDVASMK